MKIYLVFPINFIIHTSRFACYLSSILNSYFGLSQIHLSRQYRRKLTTVVFTEGVARTNCNIVSRPILKGLRRKSVPSFFRKSHGRSAGVSLCQELVSAIKSPDHSINASPRFRYARTPLSYPRAHSARHQSSTAAAFRSIFTNAR